MFMQPLVKLKEDVILRCYRKHIVRFMAKNHVILMAGFALELNDSMFSLLNTSDVIFFDFRVRYLECGF
jgi:hypothetical protein